jgi:2Fe-2S ferredoxin
MPSINVPQKNLVLQVNTGENLMLALQKAGVPVASSCLGEGICSMCKMNVQGNLADPKELEIRTLKRNKLTDSAIRLSCQIQVTSDITVITSYW